MSFFTPNQIFKSAASISVDYLAKNGIKALLLDVDNTLTAHGSQELSSEIKEWLCKMRESGIKMLIVSNNTKKRIEPFAKHIGLGFVSFAVKPSPIGPARAARRLGVPKRNIALVGDQVFTDMYAAKLYGIKILLVQPMHNDTVATIKLKRAMEKPFIQHYLKKGGTIIK